MRPTICARWGLALFAAVLLLATPAMAKNWSTKSNDRKEEVTARMLEGELAPWTGAGPAPLHHLQRLRAPDSYTALDDEEFSGLQIRREALKEAALSYGARGGLAFRTWQIREGLDGHASEMNRTFDFRSLLMAAPSGLLIEPPVITEQVNAMIIADRGQSAAVSDRVYNINREARIVAASRDWRSYMERDWSEVPEPPALLLPKTADEVEAWGKWVAQGWKAGVEQGDAIFQADLDRMVRDFTGMVRYRRLLAQGMISAPFTLHEARGITGGGEEMRVGDRQLTITGPSQFNPMGEGWFPRPQK